MDKKIIRQQMLTAREKLTPQQALDKSRMITDRLMDLPSYRGAGTIMVYLDFRNEVKTSLLIDKALREGKKIVVPIINRMGKTMQTWQLKNYPEDLAPGTYGILEPILGATELVPEEELDLVIVPGIAFDPQGNRLGYGGGYYDRFLPRINPHASTIALAYEIQILSDLSQYMGPYDYSVQYVLTENRTIETNRPGFR